MYFVCIITNENRIRPQKNLTNIRNHNIDFADVENVFYDDFAITIEDDAHSEQRYITIGMDV